MSAVTASEPSAFSSAVHPLLPPGHRRPDALCAVAAPVWCYGVSADPSPGLLLRVLEFVAKRGLVPLAVHASRGVERDPQGVADTLSVDLQVEGLEPEVARHVGECLRQIVGVRHVAMSRR